MTTPTYPLLCALKVLLIGGIRSTGHVSGPTVACQDVQDGAARSGFHASRDPATEEQVRGAGVRRVLAWSSHLQHLQRRPFTDPGPVQSGMLCQRARPGTPAHCHIDLHGQVRYGRCGRAVR